MLERLAVVLFRPKFSENVGAAARACANMGVSRLVVVDPQDFDPARAAALATAKGQDILARAERPRDLEAALAPFSRVYGTTARTGGWRKGVSSPRNAAPEIVRALGEAQDAALVFGPEDAGLTNRETMLCHRLLTIPTDPAATSLNLAQAVLVVLYECFLAAHGQGEPRLRPDLPGTGEGRTMSHAEGEALFSALRQTLSAIDFIKDDNPDYFLLPVRRFVQRVRPTRAEFNMLMGVCRQILWAVGRGANTRPRGKA